MVYEELPSVTLNTAVVRSSLDKLRLRIQEKLDIDSNTPDNVSYPNHAGSKIKFCSGRSISFLDSSNADSLLLHHR